uniref:Uncharacterized protein n=1 Tax=Globisporangium ultimum (strain ATCC 200006 / CBS 805.95 / DAOM BR144) TaxID=431595 RepID=K3XD26_GLOUD
MRKFLVPAFFDVHLRLYYSLLPSVGSNMELLVESLETLLSSLAVMVVVIIHLKGGHRVRVENARRFDNPIFVYPTKYRHSHDLALSERSTIP